ncbi:MAG: autotransporter domain-containing protein, partial [Desulfovibrionaceae bacterium]|nr:autotransporter domain-containing protein [Desulfovibrionaceae bacterium]
MQTHGAITNLKNRYRAILRGCRLKNWLACAGLVALLGGAGAAPAQAAMIPLWGLLGSTGTTAAIEDGSVTTDSATYDGSESESVESGGAINYPNIVISGSGNTFQNYQAGSGGALYSSSTITISGDSNTFSSNTATYSGGAIYLGGNSMTLSGTGLVFEGNSAEDGGALYAGEGSVTLSGETTFTENTATNVGGAICNADLASTFTISGIATFSGNSASYGGAIYNTGNFLIEEGGSVILETASDTIYNDQYAFTDEETGITTQNSFTVRGTLSGSSTRLTNASLFTVDGGQLTLASADFGNYPVPGTDESEDEEESGEAQTLAGTFTVTNGGFAHIADPDASYFIAGTITVDNNSVLMFGNYENLADVLSEAGFTAASRENPVNDYAVSAGASVLAIASPVNVGPVGLTVGSGTTVSSGVSFGSGSVLVVDASSLTGLTEASGLSASYAALQTDGAISVAADSSLVVTSLRTTGCYAIAAGASVSLEEGAWSDGNLSAAALETASALLEVTAASVDVTTDSDGKQLVYLSATIEQNSIADDDEDGDASESSQARMDAGLVTLIDNAVTAGYLDENSASFGERFINRAINNADSADGRMRTIEGAARLGMLSAIPQQLLSLGNEAGRMAQARTAFSGLPLPQGGVSELSGEGLKASGLSGGDEYKNGFALWIAPMYKHLSGADFAAGNYDAGFKTDMGGLMLGMDWTFDSSLRLGVQLNMGGGYTKSTGSFADTENSFNWWGAGLYGGYRIGNFGITADAGVTSSYNKMSQDLDSTLDMGSDLEADTRAESWTAALNFEYRVETSVLDIIPHVGARYTALHVYGYDTEAQGQTVLESDDIWAHVWQFPVGVTLTKDFVTESGWTVSPRVDFAVIPAAGDLETKQDVSFHGIPGSAELEGDIMDAWTGQGQAGIAFATGTGLSFGVDYTFQASRHQTSHGLQG